jgi:LPXTG-motif cell wall-anchored protein
MMKKSVLVFSMMLLLILSGLNVAVGQDRPKPKKDTVNMDTNAKPTFYYPVEDDKKGKGSLATIAIIVGAVVVVGAAGFFLLKKKK